MKPDEKTIERMNWLFHATFILPIFGLGLAFAGLMARQHATSAGWGIWCSVSGWSIIVLNFALRWWVKRWFRRLRQ